MEFFSDNFSFQSGLFHGTKSTDPTNPAEQEDGLVSSSPIMSNQDFFGIDTSLPFGQTQGFFSDDEEKMDYYRRQEEQEQAKERVMFNTNRALNRESGLDSHYTDSVWTDKRRKRYEKLDVMHRSLSEADDFGGLQDFWGQYGDEYTRLGSIFDDNF